MWCMVLGVDGGGLEWAEDGAVQVDGLTDTGRIGDGVVIGGEVPALVLGAPTTKVVGQRHLCSYARITNVVSLLSKLIS